MVVGPDVYEFVAWQVRGLAGKLPTCHHRKLCLLGGKLSCGLVFVYMGWQVRAECWRGRYRGVHGALIGGRQMRACRCVSGSGRIMTASDMMFDTFSCVYSAAPPTSLQCDQDAYACTGQKCSAQSIVFMHDNWAEAGESN